MILKNQMNYKNMKFNNKNNLYKEIHLELDKKQINKLKKFLVMLLKIKIIFQILIILN